MVTESSLEVGDQLVIRRFSGEVDVNMIIESWEQIFKLLGNLNNYRGVITDLLNASLLMGIPELEILTDYLKDKEAFSNIKLAVLIDNEKVILPMVANKQNTDLNIRPFVTEEAAISWIHS